MPHSCGPCPPCSQLAEGNAGPELRPQQPGGDQCHQHEHHRDRSLSSKLLPSKCRAQDSWLFRAGTVVSAAQPLPLLQGPDNKIARFSVCHRTLLALVRRLSCEAHPTLPSGSSSSPARRRRPTCLRPAPTPPLRPHRLRVRAQALIHGRETSIATCFCHHGDNVLHTSPTCSR
jgi:hypothetical protein